MISAFEYVPDSEMTSQTLGSQEDLLDKVRKMDLFDFSSKRICSKLIYFIDCIHR